jgi:hypothetical protein
MKPPQYEKMDEGRETAIRINFEKYCGKGGRYRLIEIPPMKHTEGWCGPIPRPTFEVRERSNNDLVAEFFPNGFYRCHKDEFSQIYDRMVEAIETAGKEAYDSFILEYERLRQSS